MDPKCTDCEFIKEPYEKFSGDNAVIYCASIDRNEKGVKETIHTLFGVNIGRVPAFIYGKREDGHYRILGTLIEPESKEQIKELANLYFVIS